MNNVFAFLGSDHKVGTTQISQCCAEALAKALPNKTILLIQCDGGRGSEYCLKVRESVDRIRPFLAQSIVNVEEIKEKSLYKDNLYIIGGQIQPGMNEYLTPDMSEILINAVRDSFDLVILDSGCHIEDGLSLGATLAADRVFMILNQKESSIGRYEWCSFLYERIDLFFDKFIINKYNRNSAYEISYIADRLMLDKSNIFTVCEHSMGDMAEVKAKSLISLKPTKRITNDINKIAGAIINYAGITA